MYTVSDQYKSDIHQQLRGESFVEIAHVIPNYHNVGNLSGTPTSFDVGMFENEVNQYFVNKTQIATFEPTGCLLDGSSYLRGDPTVVGNNENGEYVSTAYSGTTSAVGTYGGFTVSGHAFNINVYSVTADNVPTKIFLGFDSSQMVRPTAMTITMYDGVTSLASANYDIADYSKTYSLPTLTALQAVTLDKITVSVTAMSHPYAYVKIEKAILGIVNEFTDEQIASCEWSVKSNPLTFEIPTASFSFTFLDPNKLYHKSNPASLLGLIEENQQVGFRFGYTLNSGGIEWITGGLYRTTGEVGTEDSGIPKVTIKAAHASVNAQDLVRKLDSTLVSPNDEEVTIALTNLVDLMDSVGVTMTTDTVTPTNISSTVTVVDPNITLKEYAQLMANAHGLIWLVKRTSPYAEEAVLREFAKLIGTSEHNYDTIGLFVDSKMNQTNYYVVNDVEDTSICLFEFNNSSLYSPPDIRTVPKSDGIDYARYNIDTNETTRKPYPDPAVGTRLIKVDNAFVTTDTNAATFPNTKFGEYIHDYYGEQNTYVLSNRGFPELDIADIVKIRTEYYDTDGETVLYTLEVQGLVVANRISYNGSIKGETSVLGWQTIVDKYDS